MSIINSKTEDKLLKTYYESYISEFGSSVADLDKKTFPYGGLPIPEMWNNESKPKSIHTPNYHKNLMAKGLLKLQPCGSKVSLTPLGYDRGYELSNWASVFFHKHRVEFTSAIISAIVSGIIGLLFSA